MTVATRSPGVLFGEMVAGLLRRREMPRFDDPAGFLDSDDARRYAAAFLLTLCGEAHPDFETAQRVLHEAGTVPTFFRAATSLVHAELSNAVVRDPDLLAALVAASGVADVVDGQEAQDRVWAVTFPEGPGLEADWAGRGAELQARRRVTIAELNQDPIIDPISSTLVTANVLVAPPASETFPDYWYDHPIPLDAAPEATEIAHGLRRLNSAIEYELDRHLDWSGPLAVALSVSTTHRGLGSAARELVERVVTAIGPLPHLRVFAFDESRSRRLWDEVIAPTSPLGKPSSSAPVFGVAGPYGRHYSFLKAIAALWSVCIDDSIGATFKIDLDQSFPQDLLVEVTGQSAFEHFTTPRWGAVATSATGSKLDLAMIAGGLVNEADLAESLFAVDVTKAVPASSEDSIFFSRLPQALSTEFEIGAGPHSPGSDGDVSERVHVTGGTNGILVDRLRRWRLFTPSVIGRAEDQAYLLSGLGDAGERPAYVHEPGLIMRHDKAALIPDAIRIGTDSKHIGDLLRTRLFSSYATVENKTLLDPFTGCFVSRIPVAVTSLRFALHALDSVSAETAESYLDEGVARLEETDVLVAQLDDTVRRERSEWNRFYDALEFVEQGLAAADDRAAGLATSARAIVREAEIAR